MRLPRISALQGRLRKHRRCAGAPPRLSGAQPLVGHMLEFSKNPFEMLMRARREGGEIVEFGLLNQTVVMVTGPEANEAFFRAPDDQLCRREAYRVMTPIFGKGVVFDAPRPRMNRQLQMLMPLLRDQVMRTYPPKIEDETKRLLSSWGSRGEVDLLEAMKRLTLFSSTRCLIGDEFRGAITERFFSLYHDLEQGVNALAYVFPHAPLPKFRKRDNARVKLQRIISKFMQRRLSLPDPPRDGLQVLLESTYEDGTTLTPHELTGVLTALLLAGHHTSAGTATWVIIELLRNNAHLPEVLREIDDVAGDKELTYGMLREMTKLGNVIKEVLRLHPPLIFLFRKVLRDFEYKGYVVEKGAFLCAAPAVSHRIPSVFPNPETFRPERYEEPSQSDRFSWISFGGGKHKCTGNAFGTMQLKAIVATLLREYTFDLVDSPTSYVDNYKTPTVQPLGPCRLRYEKRATSKKPSSSGKRARSRKPAAPKGRLTVLLDRQLCQGHGVCVSEAPEIFEIGAQSELQIRPDAKLKVSVTSDAYSFSAPARLSACLNQAAKFCPNQAISIERAAKKK